MDDANAGLPDDRQFMMQQVIVVLVNRTGQGIFDGNDSSLYFLFTQISEYIFETLAGQHAHLSPKQPPRSLLAEGSPLTLKRSYVLGRHCSSTNYENGGTRPFIPNSSPSTN